jgi:hypothetical protein
VIWAGCLLAGAACSSTPNAAGIDAGGGQTADGGRDAGAAGRDGAGATGDADASGDAGGCIYGLSATPSAKISTVGIVTWATTLAAPTGAHVDFGLTTSYGMTAPVDLTAPGYRTLLLGMKPSHTYHFRVEVSGSAGSCSSDDQTITTGPPPNGLTKVTVTASNPAAAFGGFLVSGQYTKFPASTGVPAYILDADADLVWWYFVASDATCVRMSHDGSHMWINGVNVPSGNASVHRVSMDGITDEDLSAQFVGLNHQLQVLPDETVVYDAYGTNGCDDIKQRTPDGTVTTIVNAQTAHGGSGACHVNAIGYSPLDDTLVFSDLENNDLTKITRAGATVWVLNGVGDTFTGDSWTGGQHGFDILGLDDFLIFANNDQVYGGAGTGSSAIEMRLDLAAMTATQIWSYLANPPLQNNVLGDVQRLSNGNTIIAYATEGVVDEVDSAGNLIQQWSWTTSLGYIEKRATLYGPPPR